MFSKLLRQPDPSTSTKSEASIRGPGQWFRAAANQSGPNLPSSQHPNRGRGFSSIKDLALKERALKEIARSLQRVPSPEDKLVVRHPSPVNTLPDHLLRNKSSLYGTLRDQCTPPELTLPAPAVLARFPSQRSSTDSFTPDQSGVSNESSHPTTPSPAKHHAFDQFETTTLFETSTLAQPRSMGQQVSAVLRKPVSLKGKQSLATIKGNTREDWREKREQAQQLPLSPESSRATPVPYSSTKQPPVRGPIVIPNVPRRRSSLTAIHLNSLHFDSVDPNHTQLQHRASTLTEPRQHRPSTLSDTLRPVISSIGPCTPITQINLRDTLSPPLLSPPLSGSRLSQSPSDPPSANSRNSVLKQQIYLPKTFPNGPVPVLAPLLTVCHHQCYQQHKRVFASGNVICPVPCMACGDVEEPRFWKCIWCGLRVCATCMKQFDQQGRKLDMLLEWVRGREEEGMAKKKEKQQEEKASYMA